MPCSCGRTACECEKECRCCPFICVCSQCFEIRRRRGTHCRPCGGYITAYVCSMMPEWKRTGLYPNYPNLDFLRSHGHQPTSSASDGRANTGQSVTEATKASSRTSQISVAVASPSHQSESSTFDDSLIFQMDDIHFTTEVSANTSTEEKSREFRGSSHFSSNTDVSNTRLELREPQRRVRRCYNHSRDEAGLKWNEAPKCRMPIWTPLHVPDDSTSLKLRETQCEVPSTTQDGAGCSHHNPGTSISETEESRLTGVPSTLPVTDLNPSELLAFGKTQTNTEDVPSCSHHNNTNISKLEESQIIGISPKQKSDATSLKWTESPESEIMISKDIPGCSKQEVSPITDSTSYAVLPSADGYTPSQMHSGDSPPSIFVVSPRSPTHQLSTSVPSIYDLPQSTCELKSSEENTSIALDTSETSSTSNLSKLENLRISDSHTLDESSTSSGSNSSFEILPENVPNEARGDELYEQLVIISVPVASFQLNNRVMKGESPQSETSQTPSNSLKLQSPEISKSEGLRTSSKSDSSTETISRERTDNSEDEAPTN